MINMSAEKNNHAKNQSYLLVLSFFFIAALFALASIFMTFDKLHFYKLGANEVTLGISILLFGSFLWAGVSVALSIQARSLSRMFYRIASNDKSLCFMTDQHCNIIYVNEAIKKKFGEAAHKGTLLNILKDYFVNPSFVLYRLQSRLDIENSAYEDMMTRQGYSRLSVHTVAPKRFFWRLEEFVERTENTMVGKGISLPMLLANSSNQILFANDAMKSLLGGKPKQLEQIFNTPYPRNGEVVEIITKDQTSRAMLVIADSSDHNKKEVFLVPELLCPENQTSFEDFEHLPVALVRFSADGTALAANKFARGLLNIEMNEKHFFHDLYEDLGRSVQDWLSDVVNERRKGATEFLRPRLGEHESFHQVTLQRMVDNGHPGVLAVLQDATAIKLLEAQFVQSQKMQAIGQLAGGIAHDFNNLLTAITGNCDLLMMRHSPDDNEYPDLIQIQQNTNRAAALVSQLLAFSRKQMLKPECCELQNVLADLTHLLNRLVGEKTELRLVHGRDVGAIKVDKRQFEQVLMNLVVNARDAMPQGGIIEVETKAKRLEQDLMRDQAVVSAGDYTIISVRDQGVGIPADRLDKIFEPFFTTKKQGEGTGLGLSTVYGIVKQSGGFIFADSTPGMGSTFQIYFPTYKPTEEELAPKSQSADTAVIRQGDGVVLLVEDEPPVRAFACRALRMRGYTVLEASSAEGALDILEDETLQVDLFITDVVMPGLDGPGWVKRALLKRPDAKVIFMSGYAEDCLTEEQSRTPNSVFLAKPFSLRELTVMVQKQLE